MDYSKKSTKWLKGVLEGNKVAQSSGAIQDPMTHASFDKENKAIIKELQKRATKK